MNNRPILFTSACILSFIGGSIAALVFFAVALFYNNFSERVINITNDLSMEGTSRLYFLLLAIFHCISLTSIILLWKFRKNGFYFYMLAQLAIISLPIFFLGRNSFSVTNAIFTIVFVCIYFFYYKWIINTLSAGKTT